MLDFVLIGFIVSAILVFLFVISNEGHRQRREEAIRKDLHVATAIQDIQEHPRIAKAIGELQEAIAYMEAAPHDFDGRKSDAIRHARAAIEQLRRAMVYRALR